MSKGLLIGIAVFVLVALGGAGYYMMNRASTPSQNGPTMTSEEASPSTLAGLLGMSQNLLCVYNDSVTGSEGTIKVSGDRMRGEFITPVNGARTTSHILITGDTMYMWTEGASEGFMTSVSGAQEAADQAGEFTQEVSDAADLNKELEYECSDWRVNESEFDVPENINFQDFSAMIQEATESGCEACYELPEGDTRTQCLQTLGC